MTLYELKEEFKELYEMLDSETDIPTEVLADTLEGLEGEIQAKLNSIACVIKDLQNDAIALKNEADRLDARKKQKESQIDYLKNYITHCMQDIGIDKIETAQNKISFRKSEKLKISDEDKLIEWLEKNDDDKLTYSMPKISKKLVTDALKNGQEIPFCEIEKSMNIQIK